MVEIVFVVLFPEVIPIKNTSEVKLDATDNEGNTAVHHLVTSLEYGTFDNTVILKVSEDFLSKAICYVSKGPFRLIVCVVVFVDAFIDSLHLKCAIRSEC